MCRAIALTKEQNDNYQYNLYVPPITGWTTTTLTAGSADVTFRFFNVDLQATVTSSAGVTTIAGENDSVKLEMEISDDGTYSYTAVLITDRINNNPSVSYFVMFQIDSAGTISGDFLDGSVSGIVHEVRPADSLDTGSPASDEGLYIYVEGEVGVEAGGDKFLTISQFYQTDASAGRYVDPTTLSISTWDGDAIKAGVDTSTLTNIASTPLQFDYVGDQWTLVMP